MKKNILKLGIILGIMSTSLFAYNSALNTNNISIEQLTEIAVQAKEKNVKPSNQFETDSKILIKDSKKDLSINERFRNGKKTKEEIEKEMNMPLEEYVKRELNEITERIAKKRGISEEEAKKQLIYNLEKRKEKAFLARTWQNSTPKLHGIVFHQMFHKHYCPAISKDTMKISPFNKVVLKPTVPDFLKENVQFEERLFKKGNKKIVNIKFTYETGYKQKIAQILSVINSLQLNNPYCKFKEDKLIQSGQRYILRENLECILNEETTPYINRLNNLLSRDINYKMILNIQKQEEQITNEIQRNIKNLQNFLINILKTIYR